MLHGDISNRVEPRLLVVFEGLIALPGKRQVSIHTLGRRSGKRRAQVQLMELNEKMARVISDTVWRFQYTVDVVTFMDPEYLPAIEEWLEGHQIPFGNLAHHDRYALARQLAYMPNVIGVFSPDRNDVLVFGSKGYHVNPDSPRMVGGYSWQ